MSNTTDVSSAAFEYLETPDKSPNDKKLYKCLVLANGLKLLLVSDNKTSCIGNESNNSTTNNSLENEEKHADGKLSAVALMVDVGSFSEPREYPGLAHFLEHMLFMGSKKYPLENGFDKHISKFGGSNNACTDSESTLYYFEVPEQHLDSSMDCFVAQLKEPLLLEDSMTRERDAVESEYQLIVNNDGIRRDQLLYSLASDTFPHGDFTWGNLKSLKENIESEQALNSKLKEFYKRNYSAHRMYACIQSQKSLKELEALAIKHLGDVASNQLNGLDYSQFNYQNAFKKEFFEEVFFIKPVENVNRLDLTWVLPPCRELYKCKPEEFLTYLMGYEGEGSLCAYLRNRLWALELMAGADSNPMFTKFNINIILTELGLKHLDQVLNATFAFVKLFNSASELKEVYKEISFIKASNFRFATEISPGANVQDLVGYCQYYPSKDLLTGSELFYQFEEQQIQNLINHLNQFHFNITLTSQEPFAGVVYDKKEKWFGTDYTSKKIPQKWRDLWQNAGNIEELYLPKTNPFIATDFHIFCKEKCVSDMPAAPEKLLQTETCELWFRQDDRFLLPHGCMCFNIISPLIRKSGRNLVICSLYLDLLQHHLVEELYPASMAGISYSIFCSEKGVVLEVDGYNEKLYLVVEIIMKALHTTKDRLTENELETFKRQHQKNYYNALIKPEVINIDLQGFMLKDMHCLMTERFTYVADITLTDVQNFVSDFTKELYVQALIQGNLEQETAYRVLDSVMGNLNCGIIQEKYLVEDRGTEIPLGSHHIVCRNLNPKDCNSIVANFYQTGPRSLRKECIIHLLLMIVETPFYDVLRTKEQLGYCVYVSKEIFNGIMGYLFYVSSQENKHSVFHVEERMEAFRLNVQQLLENLSLEDFENFKNSHIKLKEIKDLTLHDEVGRNFAEITSEEYLFDRKYKEIAMLHSLKKQDILDFWLENETKNLRKFSVQIMGCKNVEQAKESIADESIEGNLNNKLVLQYLVCDTNDSAIVNIEEFKDKLKVYPVMKTEI